MSERDQLKTFLLFLFIVAVMALSQAASAAYMWKADYCNGQPTFQYPATADVKAYFCAHIANGECTYNGYSTGGVPAAYESTDGYNLSAQCIINGSTAGAFHVAVRVTVASCPTGYQADASGNCIPYNPCNALAGQTVNAGKYDLGTSDTANPITTGCHNGCETSYTGSGVDSRQMVGGVWHYFSTGSYTYTNRTCTAGSDPAASATLPPATCNPATQDQGQVNGVTVCLPKTQTKTTTTSAPTTNPDGSQTTTTTTTDSATGQQSTTTDTTNPDGSKTTSTTTSPTPGSGSTFCATHPSDPSCIPADDICKKHPNSAGCSELGDPGAAPAMPSSSVPVTFSPVSISQNATCPAPVMLSAFGQSFTLSYDSACQYASGLKPVVIAIGYLTALFIIFGAPRSAQS